MNSSSLSRRTEVPPTPLTVVIGDDSPIAARGVAELIGDHPDMMVVSAANDRDSLIAAVTRHDPDVVISDLRMPPTHTDEGIQVLRHVEAERLRAGFIIFTLYSEPAVAAELLATQARGRGYLLKDRLADADELFGAIRAVAAGNTVVDPSLVAQLMNAGPRSIAGLSASQREALALIAEGLSNEAIAERLNITEWAVQKRVSALFRSLQLAESPAINRRVTATLLYLAAREEPKG